MKYRCIFFDIDGTLLDTEPIVMPELQATLLELTGKHYSLAELQRFWGIPTSDTAAALKLSDPGRFGRMWEERVVRRDGEIKPFPGIEKMLGELKNAGIRLGIVTSKNRSELSQGFHLAQYFEPDLMITATDTVLHKPNPAPLLEGLRRAGCPPEDALFVGDTVHDANCAAGANAAFGLAVWGAHSVRHIRAAHYFAVPAEVAQRLDDCGSLPLFLRQAMELQFIGQAGVTYSKDPYDAERFERIRELAAEMLAAKTELPFETVKSLFCNERGFQTPKLDTRAAIFRDGKILLVHEKSGRWSLPGGWVDLCESIRSNTEKEVREEAGLEVAALRLIAVQDRNRHNPPPYAYGICKVFVLCGEVGGAFRENLETTGFAYFAENGLPPLAEEKNTAAQIRMCFDASRDPDWKVVFD